MSKYILREYYELCPGGICQDLLTEDEKFQANNGTIFLSGVMQRCDEQNGNGRVYPAPILQREVKNYMKVVKENRACGELDHPEDSVVNLKNASHMVNRIWWEGNDVMGTIKVLNTPAGSILKGLYESGVKFGFSSRALGRLKEGPNGAQIVQDDLQLICFDAVSEPSAPGAYILESKQAADLTKIFTKSDRIDRACNEVLRG